MSHSSRLSRALAVAACSVALTLAACTPASPTDTPLATLPTTGILLPATATAMPLATVTTAPAGQTTPDPLPLAAHLPLAGWDNNGQSMSLLPVDPLTGAPMPGAGWTELGSSSDTAFAPDGRTLALLVFHDPSGIGGVIHFVDLSTWTMTAVEIKIHSYPMLMQFTADGRSLIVAGTDSDLNDLARYDVATGAEQARLTLPFAPRSAGLAPDGATLLVYGTVSDATSQLNPVAHVARLNLADLALQWTAPLPEVLDGQYATEDEMATQDLPEMGRWYMPGIIWNPATGQLYLVHADADQLTTIDFAAESVRTVAIAPAQSWLDRFMAFTAGVAEAKMLNGATKQAVLGPDGRLYVLGYAMHTVDQYSETPLGLQVIDPATGALLDTVATTTRNLRLSADAAGAPVLLLEGWSNQQWTEVRSLADPHTVLAQRLNLSFLPGHLPNGAPVLLGREDRPEQTIFHLIDLSTWHDLAQWPVTGLAEPILLP